MKRLIHKTYLLRRLAGLFHWRKPGTFPGSEAYWEQRYANGGNSGIGSYGSLARFKADIINRFVATHYVRSVIEFGCGDGNQLRLAQYPSYLGLDVSETAISLCKEKFAFDPTKSFRLMKNYSGEMADLALSLDVIYHLVEDSVFESHMKTLFKASRRYVIVYSSNSDSHRIYEGTHVKHRKFTDWIITSVPHWKMIESHEGPYANFYIYEKK